MAEEMINVDPGFVVCFSVWFRILRDEEAGSSQDVIGTSYV
jgi:hypothetical protein